MAALSGEKTLAELSSEFGVHPTMISTWKQELSKRASELFARGNAEQGEGLPSAKAEPPALPPAARIEGADRFFAATGAEIRHGGTRAYYAEGPDYVQMPPFETFVDAESHAATLAHELTHWTEHEKRLARDMGRIRWGYLIGGSTDISFSPLEVDSAPDRAACGTDHRPGDRGAAARPAAGPGWRDAPGSTPESLNRCIFPRADSRRRIVVGAWLSAGLARYAPTVAGAVACFASACAAASAACPAGVGTTGRYRPLPLPAALAAGSGWPLGPAPTRCCCVHATENPSAEPGSQPGKLHDAR
jgi:transposase-like protein